MGLARSALLARLARIAALAALAGVLGCSSSGGGDAPAPTPDAGEVDSGVAVTCQNDPRVEAYVANMKKASPSGALAVTLVSSDPGPPIRGTNTWIVRVTDGAGAPVSNAALSVVPFMPDHGHGTSVKPTITAEADGRYRITNVYFFMPGVWRVTVGVPQGDAGATEAATFHFCVAG